MSLREGAEHEAERQAGATSRRVLSRLSPSILHKVQCIPPACASIGGEAEGLRTCDLIGIIINLFWSISVYWKNIISTSKP